MPDYDWFIKYGLDAVRERSYKDAIKKYRDDQVFRYVLPYFTTEEITQFIEKYVVPAPMHELALDLARKIYSASGGNPVLVKFAVLGNGLRKAVEDRIEDYLKNPEYMLTTLAMSILNM